MSKPNQLESIRLNIEKQIGENIKIVSKKGKRQIITRTGIITNAYPGVFVVKIFEKNNRETFASYSYSDILTKTVKLSIVNN